MRNCFPLLAGMLLLVPHPEVAQGSDPGQRARVIAPFVDEQTVLVAHLSLAEKGRQPRADLDAVHALIVEIVRTAVPAEEDATFALRDVQEAKAAADRWLGNFRKAGATELYAVVSITDLPAHPQPFMVVPVVEGADARAIAGLLCNGSPTGSTTRPAEGQSGDLWTAEQLGPAIFCGARSTLDRLRSAKPADRPELIKAFEAASDTAAQILLLPTPDSRRVLEDLIPTLPPSLGGGQITAVTRGVMWAAIGINTQPQVSLRLVIQSENPQAAQALSKVCDAIFKAALADERLRREVTNLEEIIGLLQPSVAEDRLVLTVDAEKAQASLTRAVAPLLSQTRERAQRVASLSNIKQIMMACLMYAADHKGQWPEDLESLAAAKLLPASVLVNPLRGPGKPGYIYVRPAPSSDKTDPRAALVYEAHTTWGEGICVGYADGHAEFVTDQARLKEALSRAQTKPASAAP